MHTLTQKPEHIQVTGAGRALSALTHACSLCTLKRYTIGLSSLRPMMDQVVCICFEAYPILSTLPTLPMLRMLPTDPMLQ